MAVAAAAAVEYPDSIVTDMAVRHKLSSAQQQQLRDALLVDAVRSKVTIGVFNPEDLLIHVATESSAVAGGAHEVYISVLSTIAAKHVVTDLALLEALRKIAADNPAAFREWDAIKLKLALISALSPSKFRERKELAQALIPRLDAVSKMIEDNTLLLREHLVLSKMLFQYINGLIEPIQDAATLYFRGLFEKMGRRISPDGISFTNKNDGVQLGTIMTIVYKELDSEEEKRIRYYIKTHQYGSTSKIGAVKSPDPKELFVYKVLEHIGYGPRTYFFFNPVSPGGFYITTQDLGFTKVPGKSKSFVLFQSMIDTCNADPKAPQYDPMRRALIAFDIVSRILRLIDTTTNPGNLGRVAVGLERSKWKLFDFRVRDAEDGYVNEVIVSSFLAGNTSYNYAYSTFLEYAFKNPEYEARKIEAAYQTMIELLREGKLRQDGKRDMLLPEAIARAHDEIKDYIEANYEKLGIDLSVAVPDFERYCIAIQENLKMLSAGIAKRHAELNPGSSAAAASTTK